MAVFSCVGRRHQNQYIVRENQRRNTKINSLIALLSLSSPAEKKLQLPTPLLPSSKTALSTLSYIQTTTALTKNIHSFSSNNYWNNKYCFCNSLPITTRYHTYLPNSIDRRNLLNVLMTKKKRSSTSSLRRGGSEGADVVDRRRSPRLRLKNILKEGGKDFDNEIDVLSKEAAKDMDVKKTANTIKQTSNKRKKVSGVDVKEKKGRTTNDDIKATESHREMKRKKMEGISESLPSTSREHSSENNYGNNKKEESLLLLDLGSLVKGELIKRPSSKIRSPYVADVRIIGDNNSTEEQEAQGGDENGDIVQAHAPALDVGGLCSVGATVFMSKRKPGGKTSHSIELVLAPGPKSKGETNNDDDYVLVGCHPSLGEKLAEEVLKRGLLQECLDFGPAKLGTQKPKEKKKDKRIKTKKHVENAEQDKASAINDNNTPFGTYLYKQRTYGDSRIDFELVNSLASSNKGGSEVTTKRALIEVKNVVCSDYSAQYAPVKTGPNHCVVIAPESHNESSSSEDYKRSGIFPWGRVGQVFEGKKVVSERAIKHLRNLSKLSSDKKDKNEGVESVQTVVLFVINRSDCKKMRACHEACPVFATELRATSDQGTLVLSFRICWTENGKAYFDGIVPVSL